MSEEVKVFINDGRLFQIPHYIRKSKVEKYIQEWKEVLLPQAKEENADHFVYCTKSYKADGVTLSEVNIYMEPLSDADFVERTDLVLKEHPNTYIGAWHKGTSY